MRPGRATRTGRLPRVRFAVLVVAGVLFALSGSAGATTPRSNGLSVTIYAAPTAGPVPLSVYFQANVTGAPGAGLGLNWSFGDGASAQGISVRHEYTTSGNFTVELVATGPGGERSTANTSIRVSANATIPAPRPDAAAPANPWPEAAALFLGGAAVGALALFGAYRLGRRPEPGEDAPTPPAAALAVPPRLGAPIEPARKDGLGGPPPAPAVQRPIRPRTTERLLLHLAGLGPLDAQPVAEFARTQDGIGEALGSAQNVVSPLLRRLLAAGVVRVELRHVSGQARRRKVYALTHRGEALARDLWARRTAESREPARDGPR